MKKPKVVFTFVEAGMGHIAPMTGMSRAFIEKYGDKCEVIKSYIFSESKYPSVVKLGKALAAHTKRAAFNKLYNKLEAFSYAIHSKIILKILDANFRKARKDFFKEFKDLKPDLLVSSYYKPSHLAAQANKKGLSDTLIATYTPDPYVYPAWDRDCDIYIVNNHQAKRIALKKGFKQEQVKQVPFIYNDAFLDHQVSKDQAREFLGFTSDEFIVLITNGAYGSHNTKKLIKKILKDNIKAKIICACGKDNELVEYINQNKADRDVEAIGYTDKLNYYMLASDLIVGKGGANTLMEATFVKKPMIICDRANRLEEIISKFGQDEGLAIIQTKPKKVIQMIKDEIEGKTHFKDFNQVAEKYHDTTGAERAADELFALLKTRYPDL